MDKAPSRLDTAMGEAAEVPLVSAAGLWKSYGTAERRLEILRDAEIRLAPGDTLAVVGASGIGKSTLLHILGTLDRPDKGNLIFQGEDILAYDDPHLARFRNRSIGFVFQFHHLLQEFSALENTMMPLLINGIKKVSAAAVAEEILVRVGLKDRLHHRVTDLSGGEQQRVALGRALVRKPLLLLADEPTGNLDESNSRNVHELLMELNAELGMTMVVVTHNLSLARYMSRTVTVSEGRVVELNRGAL